MENIFIKKIMLMSPKKSSAAFVRLLLFNKTKKFTINIKHIVLFFKLIKFLPIGVAVLALFEQKIVFFSIKI